MNISSSATPAAGPARSLRGRLLDRGIQALGIGTFYVAVLVYFSISAPHFLDYTNGVNILANVSIIGIVALGQTLVILSGGFDLSVGATMPLGAVAYVALVNGGMSPVLAALLVIPFGAAFGLLNGIIITKVGINPLIATLGTLSIGVGIAYIVTNGVTEPLDDLDAGFWRNTAFADISYDIVLFLVLTVVAWLVLRFTVFGRLVYAIGGNRDAARLAGIRVDLVTVGIYVICGATAALAGEVVASQVLAGSPTLGATAPLTSIAAVILGGAALTGGVGGITGTVLGVLVLGTIANGMALMQIQSFYQEIATGCVLLLAVAFGQLRTVLSRS